jgi:chemotaxis protein MotB
MFSCVPISKFNEIQQKADKCSEENTDNKSKIESLEVSNKELASKIDQFSNDNAQLLKDTLAQYQQIKQMQLDYNKLGSDYNDLKQAEENLSKGSAAETKKLLAQLQSTQQDLQKREDELRKLEGNFNEKQQKFDLLSIELEKRNEKMKEMESILNRKDSVVNALKNKVSAALLGLENNGLSVKIKNGKVYISLEEKLLFKSGSTSVDQGGVNALKKLTKVLEQNTDINIMIEGHTDDIPYRTDAAIKDNWDLSVKRSTAIIRILLDGSSINPIRLTAAGRGEFLPVDTAKTAEARQKNRRIEIILTPKLDELFKILDNN